MKEIHKLYYELGGTAMLNAITNQFKTGDPVRVAILVKKLDEINKAFQEKTEKEFPKEVTQ